MKGPQPHGKDAFSLDFRDPSKNYENSRIIPLTFIHRFDKMLQTCAVLFTLKDQCICKLENMTILHSNIISQTKADRCEVGCNIVLQSFPYVFKNVKLLG